MLYTEMVEFYKKLRLMHYRSLFGRIKERAGSLSATEAFSVDVIYLLGKPTIKRFSEFLGISQPNATYKVNNLVAKGYITREPSEEDRRESRLCLSEKFYAYYDLNNQFIAEAVEKLRVDFSAEELQSFEKMLRALVETMPAPAEQ